MESQASIDAKIRLNSLCVLTERERFPVMFWRSYTKDMRLMSEIDSLTNIASQWSFANGPSYTQFRAAADRIAAESNIDFKANTFEQLDAFRNRDKSSYDSAPFTRIAEMIESAGFTRLKAYALLVHWNHHREARDNLFANMDSEAKAIMTRAEKLGVTPEVLAIQKQIKAKKTELAALERKLTPAQNQLAKYQEIVDRLTESHSSICDEIESLEHQAKQVRIMD